MEVNVNKFILSFPGVPENDIVYFSTLFPNTISNQDEGLMYLGFVLAPYDYLKKKIGSGWVHKWKIGLCVVS